jgi:hypothetical protein
MLGTVILVLLMLLLVVTWPSWPYSREWGYIPTGAVALLIVAVLILAYSGLLAIRNPFATQ